MVTSGERTYGNPVLLRSDKLIRPRRIPFTEKTFEEGWIQELIRKNPELLPVTDIEPAFSPLVSVGMEVATEVGSIDNLYLSPEGYLTIVETKLWRNPEARRQVVGQIIDYAKEISQWSFDELENRVRAYNRQYRDSDQGIVDTLRLIEDIDQTDESSIVDAIIRNLQRGRFLLLIVGDGIRENVEAMVDFLAQTPQLQFTLALVELQVYEVGTDQDKEILVISQVVTRTREIVRAIVRVEGRAIESVRIGVDTSTRTDGPRAGRHTISEEDYFETLGRSLAPGQVQFARRIIIDMENRGCVIQWRQASYVVKLPDPGGSGQNLTLFVVAKDGKVYPGWLVGQLRTLALPEEIGIDFVRESAKLFKGCEVHRKNPDSWSRSVVLEELQQRYDDFVSLIERAIVRIREESARAS